MNDIKLQFKQLTNTCAEWGDDQFCSITSWHNGDGADVTFTNVPPLSLDNTQLYSLLAVLSNYVMVSNIKTPGTLNFASAAPQPQPQPSPEPQPEPEPKKSEPAPDPIPFNITPTPQEQQDTFSGIIPNEEVLKKKKTIKIQSLEALINEILSFGDYLDNECEALYPIVLEHESTRGSDEGSQKVQNELEKRLDLINFVRKIYKESIESKLIYEDA